jgi:DNA-directed RNA polymerase subunit K/omega
MLAALQKKAGKNEVVTREEIDTTKTAINELAPDILDPTRFWSLKQSLEDVETYFQDQSTKT